MLKVIIDRLEESFVVCYDGNKRFYDIPKAEFSIPVHEGDHLAIELDEENHIRKAVFLEEETRAEREEVISLMKSLRRNKK